MHGTPNPEITYFAKTNFRNQRKLFGIKQEDRAYHTYVLGKTGTGKTNLLLTQILQDIQSNRGVCVFDVHGDLINTVTKHLPQHRLKDVVYLDIPNPNLSFGYNPLKRVSYEKRSLVASGILETFQKLWSGAWGVRLEHILRYILLTLLDQPKANFSDIPRIIHDASYRNKCVKNIVNNDVKQFWEKEFVKYSKADIVPLLNKIGAFLVHPAIKRILVENRDNVSLRRIMDERKILLVNLSKGIIGSDVAHILGSLLLTSMTSASFSRIDTPEEKRVPFHIFLDEFQNYTTPTLVNLLSEIRKMKVILTMGHQYFHQLEIDIRNAVIGNVGTIICFRLGAIDGAYMQKELYKDRHPIIEVGDYVNLENYHIYLRLMINGKPNKPFSAVTIPYTDILGN